ncbi:uncharacterized protein KY384_004885 [Bacidia gigantensis]|uniref:uncharacterized protein n=1 Tax=Bacidia gigantensis TaxID=2732470 RepID=UPI001D04C8E6|nr:uncharacterized protein KY384_004885 [Bacidia gigantensis]KAG8530383.1 hypothetical protein KY384_004885 [Bacidia gigantensis]
MATSRRVVVLSGGSAANNLVDVFDEVIQKNGCSLTYIIPISDNGGSSSELIRVFGGPGIGDIRSRLVRLIPPSHEHIRNLFNHRLAAMPESGEAEFLTILNGTSSLYDQIPAAQGMLIRSILSHLYLEILKRNRPPSSTFSFQSASIGNLFLTGARLFSGSFESAIYLLATMGGVQEARTSVLPAIVSNFSHHIAAGLENGTIITGQNAISHPSEPTALNQADLQDDYRYRNPLANGNDTTIEDANLPGSLPTLRKPNIAFSKVSEEPLPARIERIWYINPYGHEMLPPANPKVLTSISSADALIYSIGSLYTSIVPSLILQGVGARISGPSGPRFKILILNGSLDRETGNYAACDYLDAVTRACVQSQSASAGSNPTADRNEWRKYVTHLFYLEGDGVPFTDQNECTEYGIECVRLYGRKTTNGAVNYNESALSQALCAILGKREKGERSRRNTLLP